MKKLFVISLSIIVSGCTVLGIPTSETYAKQFDTVENFIVNNFVSTIDLIGQDKEKLKKDGVIWQVSYNNVNAISVKKPKRDLDTYCKSKGGTLVILAPETFKSMKDYFSNKDTVMIETMDTYYSRKSMYGRAIIQNEDQAGKISTKPPVEEIDWSAVQGIYNNKVQAKANLKGEVWQPLFNLAKNGYFGAFSCQINGNDVWVSTIDVKEVTPYISEMTGQPVNRISILISGKTLTIK